ncbi:MAG: hypothetical protein IT535_13095 [Bauldia sp.]|nr:hypothetical protein [Bauldia sp.]
MGFACEASAQTPARVGTFRDWSTYTYTGASGKVCFASTQPRETLPTNVNRDPVFFFITTTPGTQVREEPSIRIGYPFRPDSRVNLTIGDQTFVLMTQGEDAWVENQALEAALITAMRAGQSMVVRGISQRGTNTTDTYSLLGVTAALNSVATECPMPGGTPPA